MSDLVALVAPFLSVGGNLAMIFAAIGLWRLDRRLVRIETHLFGPQGVIE